MFETVLVAVDGSEHSHKAVAAAAELVKLSNGKLIVVHVREHDRSRGQVWDLETDEEAQGVVKKAVEEAKKNGAANAEPKVIGALHGTVAKALVETASDHKAGAIVMGSRGLSDLTGLLLGSVAHKVIHLSDVPVMVAR